jgi:hypothetical protein
MPDSNSHHEDLAAVRAEITAFREEVNRKGHGLSDAQLTRLRVILKWAEWLADGGTIIRGLLGVVVFCAGAYAGAKMLIQEVLK